MAVYEDAQDAQWTHAPGRIAEVLWRWLLNQCHWPKTPLSLLNRKQSQIQRTNLDEHRLEVPNWKCTRRQQSDGYKSIAKRRLLQKNKTPSSKVRAKVNALYWMPSALRRLNPPAKPSDYCRALQQRCCTYFIIKFYWKNWRSSASSLRNDLVYKMAKLATEIDNLQVQKL